MAEDNKVKDVAQAAQEKMGGLEDRLDKHSEKLPELKGDTKTMVGKALPWGGGLFGLLALFWANDLWDGIKAIDLVDDFLGGFATSVLPSKTAMWVGVVLFVLVAVFAGMAFAKGILNKMKTGWNFMFYSMVTAVVAGVWYFIGLSELSSGRAFLSVLIGLGGLYALFQVRDSYKK